MITEITGKSGITSTYKNDLLIKVEDSFGRVTLYDYNKFGLLAYITEINDDGQFVKTESFEYDNQRREIKWTDEVTLFSEEYYYEDNKQLIKTV